MVEYLIIIFGYFFLFLHKNICCGYSVEAPCQGASEYPPHLYSSSESKKKRTCLFVKKQFIRSYIRKTGFPSLHLN